LAAFRAGQDIKDAVETAGYSSSLAESTYNKIMSSRRQTLPIGTPVAPNVKRYVKNCMKNVTEVQCLTTNLANTVMGTAGSVTSAGFELITQGSTDSSRKGDVIHVKRFRLKGFVFGPNASGFCRIIVFRDLQSNGTTPTVAQVLATATVYGMFNSSTDTAYGGARFNILSDKTYVQNIQVAATAITLPYDVSFKDDFMITYITNGGTAASVGTGNIWILAVADNATSSFTSLFKVNTWTDKQIKCCPSSRELRLRACVRVNIYKI